MSPPTVPGPQQQASPFARVAIIDDVYAGPTVAEVKEGLAEFCAVVSAEDELPSQLEAVTACDFSDPAAVDDTAIAALSQHKAEFQTIAEAVDKLFERFNQRFSEVERIHECLAACGHHVETFHSVEKLFDGEPFQLVLLDLFLAKGQPESEEIAKQVYAKFRSFIILMSNKPGAASREEEFRRRSRLLRGFFHFCEKAELCNNQQLTSRLEALPKNHDACHAVHDFVDAIDQALGGPIPEPVPQAMDAASADSSGQPIEECMHTLRTLGLQDYAILCELTLRDEGHPLGDYMMRMLGCHLIANLLADYGVRSSIAKLDKLRFTEFLPYGEETSDSFKKLYADSLTERVVEPWSSHPWHSVVIADDPQPGSAGDATAVGLGDTEDGAASASGGAPLNQQAKKAGELIKTLGFSDDGKDLPFLQLGDLLVRDDASLVYAVLTASCDLQFTPENVSQARPRERDDTVLLLPGSLRKIGDPPFPKKRATTGLIRWNDAWYSVDWFDRKLLGLPHCVIRTLFEGSGYKHEKRLLMARALELQHTVLSWVSRIGLEVQPPLPIDLVVTVFGKQADNTFARLGEVIAQGALLFHLRDRAQPMLVFRRSTFNQLRHRMEQHADGISAPGATTSSTTGVQRNMRVAITALAEKMVGMKVPVVIPLNNNVASIRLLDNPDPKKGSTIPQIGFRIGRFMDAPAPTDRNFMFCISVEVA